jgi:hypothetical protein
MLKNLQFSQSLKIRLMLAVGCCAILGTSSYDPPVLGGQLERTLPEAPPLVVRVRLNAAAREQAGEWSIHVAVTSEVASRVRIVPERGPLGLKQEVMLETSEVSPLASAAGSAAADDDAGAAGSAAAPPPVQTASHVLRPDLAACPDGACEVEFRVEVADAPVGGITLWVYSWAQRPWESGCMGDAAPAFTGDAELEVTSQ